MNTIFLHKNIEAVSRQPIESATMKVVTKWTRQLDDGDHIIPSLEADMYKLSIESECEFGLALTNNIDLL